MPLSSHAQMDKYLDPGISIELAQHRKQIVSDLTYSLSFDITADKSSPIHSKESINLTLSKKDEIIIDFDAYENMIREIKVNKKKCPIELFNGHIIIPQKLTKKGRNTITIDFFAGNQGLNRRDGYIYTLFVPDRAHTVFPCFDQPDLKAKFNLDLKLPSGWTSVCNGISVPSSKSDGTKCSIDTPIPTYLFAFAAGEFKYQVFNKDGRTIGAYYRENDSLRISQLPDIIDQVFFSLKWQEDFTGMPYPFPKYDLVILPGFQFGGMEHVGATFYNDNTLFLPANPTPDEQLRRAELIAHETSHMWFGDAVTMKWFDDVWTKEVFANYFAAEITEPLFPTLDHKLNWLRSYQGAAITQDRTEGRTSIHQSLGNMNDAGLVYNSIIYNKAPVMMRKMVALMGKDAFRSGIQKYLQKYKYDNASWDDLIAILDTETPVDLKAFSKDWVDTPNWPHREAKSYKDAFDTDYYGFTRLHDKQIDSLWFDFPHDGAKAMAAMMTLNENYLNHTIEAEPFARLMWFLAEYDDPQICSAALGYMYEPLLEIQQYAIDNPKKLKAYHTMEKGLWKNTYHHPLKSVRTETIRLMASRAICPAVIDSLYAIWKSNSSPLLSINDYCTLAYELSIRMPEKADFIISTQRNRITNPDRLAQFDFISRAVSSEQKVRDELFESLKKAENRRIEPWALSALYYLNHPMLQVESRKYIRPALDLLPEIQSTGDIFLPANWCSRLLAGHRSAEAYGIVEKYLKDNLNMKPMLRSKLLTAAYYLQRANKK